MEWDDADLAAEWDGMTDEERAASDAETARQIEAANNEARALCASYNAQTWSGDEDALTLS